MILQYCSKQLHHSSEGEGFSILVQGILKRGFINLRSGSGFRSWTLLTKAWLFSVGVMIHTYFLSATWAVIFQPIILSELLVGLLFSKERPFPWYCLSCLLCNYHRSTAIRKKELWNESIRNYFSSRGKSFLTASSSSQLGISIWPGRENPCPWPAAAVQTFSA